MEISFVDKFHLWKLMTPTLWLITQQTLAYTSLLIALNHVSLTEIEHHWSRETTLSGFLLLYCRDHQNPMSHLKRSLYKNMFSSSDFWSTWTAITTVLMRAPHFAGFCWTEATEESLVYKSLETSVFSFDLKLCFPFLEKIFGFQLFSSSFAVPPTFVVFATFAVDIVFLTDDLDVFPFV